MPVYDFACRSEGCEGNGIRFESLIKRWDSPNPECPHCHAALDRLPAAPKPIWTKNWAEYGVPKNGTATDPNWTPDGVWAYRTKSTRNTDGSKEKVLLTSHAEMRSYCRDEGLIPPDEVNSNAEVSKDGRTLSTSGVRGQWL